MRSEIFQKVLDEITPEWLEEQKNRREKIRKSLTTSYQLGYYVAREIINRYLPTLSTDPFTNGNVIQVSEEDTKTNNQLQKEWLSQHDKETKEAKWISYLEHNKFLEKKYLPNPLVCYLPVLNIEDSTEFMKGLHVALWDCDICSYNIQPENIKIYQDEEVYQTVIELVLD